MSYTALYRKFRPATFADVKGQDHIVTTLKNQIKADRIGHAYLFCGTRGTGKTTVAKILARSVNCETPEDGSPCGTCPTCQAIANGSALNIIEIDAASNNGVDNVREIIDEVTYSPTTGRFKVYIIDEVHMLSTGAFNALLKTLEEPPEYVIFILATTEPHKLPITIQSRCQRYDFHRITIDTIQSRLRTVVDEEGLSVDDKALRYVAKAGDGSMRDALSLLDQCVAFHYGETLTYDMALDVLGAVDTGVFDQLLNAVFDADVVEALKLLQMTVEQGRELAQFNNDFIWYIRSAMLMKTNSGLEEVIDLNSEDMARLKATAERLTMEAITRYIRILSDLTAQLRYSTQKRILLEVTLIRMCMPQTGTENDDLAERVRHVENQISGDGVDGDGTGGNGSGYNRSRAASSSEIEELRDQLDDLYDKLTTGEFGIALDGSAYTDASGQGRPGAGRQQFKRPELPKALPEEVRDLNNYWREVMKALGEPLASYYNGAVRSVSSDGRLLLVWEESDFAYGSASKEDSINRLHEAIEQVLHKSVEVNLRAERDARTIRSTYPDISKMVQTIDVAIEEEPMEGYAGLYDEKEN